MANSRFQAEYRKPDYVAYRSMLKMGWHKCSYCHRRGTTPDHVPPLSAFPPGLWHGRLVPCCGSCNSSRGGVRRQRSKRSHSRVW